MGKNVYHYCQRAIHIGRGCAWLFAKLVHVTCYNDGRVSGRWVNQARPDRQTKYSGVEDEGILLTRAQPINCELGRPPEWAISIDITKAFELWPSKFRPLLSATISYDSLSSPSTWPHFGCKVDHKVIIIGIHKIFGWSTGLQHHHHPPSTWHYGPGHSMMMNI